jgi:hypothetical protein
MIARRAQTVELSTGFHRKLSARLAAEKLARPHNAAIAPTSVAWASLLRTPVIAAVALISAGLGFQAAAFPTVLPSTPVVLAPVVVAPATAPPQAVAAPALFATISSSLPVYPAMLLAQRATEQFAATHARTLSFQATH